jgi:hypothetical protein
MLNLWCKVELITKKWELKTGTMVIRGEMHEPTWLLHDYIQWFTFNLEELGH